MSIRAWRIAEADTDPKSRLIYEGRLDSIEMVREMQERFEVENQNCFWDVNYDAERVAKAREKYKREVIHEGRLVGTYFWVLLRGDKQTKGFPVVAATKGRKVETTMRMFEDPKEFVTSDSVRYRTVRFSNKLAKDKLAALIKSNKLGAPKDASRQYRKQMQSEHKMEVTPGEFRWIPVRKNIDNHLWDCETMGIVGASMRGILRTQTVSKP